MQAKFLSSPLALLIKVPFMKYCSLNGCLKLDTAKYSYLAATRITINHLKLDQVEEYHVFNPETRR